MQYEDLKKEELVRKLFSYSIPLILGNVVLLSYDLVDALVISKFVGEVGLSAVSNAGQITSFVLLFYYGLCMGASVIISEYYGARDMVGVKLEVSTVLLSGLAFTAFLSISIFLLSENIFRLMLLPNEVMSDAIAYLKIACIGFPFVFTYQVFAGALKAMGNSSIPTFFLALSAVLNIIFDLVCVTIFKWGVAGASIATVVAQIISCTITYIYVQIKIKDLRLGIKDLVIKKRLLVRTFRDGMITAVQQTVPPLGRILIIAKVNTLGVIASAANGILNKIDMFAILPATNISLAIMTYTAQSRGAKRNDLIYNIFRAGFVVEITFSVIIFAILFFFKYNIMVILSPKDSIEIIDLGNSYLHIMAYGYLLVGIVNVFLGFFRGMGNMSLTLNSSIINLTIKVSTVYLFIATLGLDSVAWGTTFGWIGMITYGYLTYRYYRNHKWKDVYITPSREQIEKYHS